MEVSKGWSETGDGAEKVPGYPGVWTGQLSQRTVVALGRDEADRVVGRGVGKGELSLAENLTTLKSAPSLPTSLRLLSFSIPSILLILPKPVSPTTDGPKTPFLSLTLSTLDFAAAMKFYFAVAGRRTK